MQAWRRLTITRNHLDLLKDMPLPVTFVILQHSPCKSILHAAIIEKPRTGLQTGKKKEAAAPGKALILFPEVLDLCLFDPCFPAFFDSLISFGQKGLII